MGILKSIFFATATVAIVIAAFRGEGKLAQDRAAVLKIRTWCFAMSVAAAATAILATQDAAKAFFAAHPEPYETPALAGARGAAMMAVAILMAATVLFAILIEDGKKRREIAVWRAAARARREREKKM